MDLARHVLTHWNYLAVIMLMMIGLYIAISRGNLVKKVMGMNIFQVSVILLYVSMGKISGGTAPILIEGRSDIIYSNPLPHVLMLTAIVVGIATTSLALALIVRIREEYGTIEEQDIWEAEQEISARERRQYGEVFGEAGK